MRRLYIGGLSHTVTEKDLKDRFGKFGVVEDVELRTRRDEEGVAYKTFGYININISDADLKKCLTVLNKSKWKGGTLQIETAKQSFLHKLSEERQAAAELRLQQPTAKDSKQKILDSLSKAGVDNFTMKAAVPGTEIPGHKDWVVSKFGRVLPVLQLRCRKGNKARSLKYDPSKYSHNIRRLDRDGVDLSTPVSQLTWQVEGGDDDISRKRRGEFPRYEPPKAKRKQREAVNSHSRSERSVPSDVPPLTNVSKPPQRVAVFQDSDLDSDEEIRRLVEAQQNSHHATLQQEEEDGLEVVGLDFLDQSGHKGDEDDYNSADTDELFASRKKPEEEPPLSVSKTNQKKKNKKESKARANVLRKNRLVSAGDETSESSDSDYEATFSNVTHLEISLADLQKLAENAVETTTPSMHRSEPSPRSTTKKGITPEEILASLLCDDSSDEEIKKKKKKKRKHVTSLPAFQGTGSLSNNLATDGSQKAEEEEEKKMVEHETQKPKEKMKEKHTDSSKDLKSVKAILKPVREDEASSSEEDKNFPGALTQSEEVRRVPRRSSESEEELQRKANLRRLNALQVRQREAEEHKKLIQGALANLDGAATKTGKHIVFGSEDEEEEEEESQKTPLHDNQSEEETAAANRSAVPRPLLFEGSDEEVEEDDVGGFHIRPQFEGEAGQKLMALQSRFGTDERFRMDARFLVEEDDDEEETGEKGRSLTEGEESLVEEKKKSLSILQSVLGTDQSAARRTEVKAKKFRDVSALHYDPSKEEHAAYETKTDGKKKESKACRRKKREEAEKLPEVSKEIYYEVSGDLKAVFGQTESGGAEEEKNWDKAEEKEETSAEEEEETSEFKFSFFEENARGGDDEEQAEYTAENVKVPKVSWQQDPRFHDSSSDDEEEEEEEERDEEQNSLVHTTTEEETPSRPETFFFYSDDLRLKDGPSLFLRPPQLEEMREQWEERRTALRLEYRKKHKDALRKQAAMKS